MISIPPSYSPPPPPPKKRFYVVIFVKRLSYSKFIYHRTFSRSLSTSNTTNELMLISCNGPVSIDREKLVCYHNSKISNAQHVLHIKWGNNSGKCCLAWLDLFSEYRYSFWLIKTEVNLGNFLKHLKKRSNQTNFRRFLWFCSHAHPCASVSVKDP